MAARAAREPGARIADCGREPTLDAGCGGDPGCDGDPRWEGDAGSEGEVGVGGGDGADGAAAARRCCSVAGVQGSVERAHASPAASSDNGGAAARCDAEAEVGARAEIGREAPREMLAAEMR